jgi:hypothetical protein
MSKIKLVIVGGVAGGFGCGKGPAFIGNAEIILLERGAYVSFAICGLPYHIGGEIPERQQLLLKAPQDFLRHCCKVSDEAAFCLIQRPYISKTLLTRRISPRGSP